MMLSSKTQSSPLKIVVDTNLYLSLFVFHSRMLHHIFELVSDAKLALYISPKQLTEIQEKFAFFAVKREVQEKALFFINAKATVVHPTLTIQQSRDKEDDFLLELAETAQASYLITRDNDVLILHAWKSTTIIIPEDFLPVLRDMKLLK